MTPPDIERIAKGLTKAQREAVRDALWRGPNYRVEGFEVMNGRVIQRLVKRGLVSSPSWNRGALLTTSGLSVRYYILEQEQKHG